MKLDHLYDVYLRHSVRGFGTLDMPSPNVEMRSGPISLHNAIASDYIHPTPRGGRCRVRIYLPEDEQDTPVVICSELPNNGGTSFTYAAEQLVAEVIRSPRLPTPLVWIDFVRL
jgi:hypothetical protein